MLDWLLELPVDTLLPLDAEMVAVGEWSLGGELGGLLTETMYGLMGLFVLLVCLVLLPGILDFLGLGG